MKAKVTKITYPVDYRSSLLVDGRVNKVSYSVPNGRYSSQQMFLMVGPTCQLTNLLIHVINIPNGRVHRLSNVPNGHSYSPIEESTGQLTNVLTRLHAT
jgi:hypothetical protein